MKKRKKGLSSVRILTMSAMLTALSSVVGIFCKSFLDYGIIRITFENFPVILSGIMFGPWIGAIVGICADLLSYALSMQKWAISPIITLGAALVGFVSGAVSHYIIKKGGIKRVILSTLFAHIVGSMIVKSIGLFGFYEGVYGEGWLILWRIPLYIVIASLESIIICLMVRNKNFQHFMHLGEGEKRAKMTHREALEYIHSINWTFTKPGLERIGELCEKLGNPEKELKFIHVAGTNGKGSFCAMTDSVLRAAGYKTGLFTSPYIKEFGERIRYCGENISEKELAEITEYVKPFADSMEDKPTEFELITAIGLEYFRRKKCDVVILEAGMGGRLDSTNIIPSSVLSVITGIALDHTAYLGDTVEKIAAEKAGIIKQGGKVLYGGVDDSAENVIMAQAQEMSASYKKVDRSTLDILSSRLGGTVFNYKGREKLELSLLGLYQPKNAATVLDAIDVLRECGFEISEEAIRKGLKETKWYARFEVIANEPTVIFDGAHNPEGIETAVESIKYYFADKKVCVLTGVMKDKDYNYIAGKLSEIADSALVITPDNPRALDANEYASVLAEKGIAATAYGSVKEALAAGKELALKQETALVCLGSLYMYKEVADNI